jgi:hypothetical protein
MNFKPLQGPPRLAGRVITKDRALSDGTPRREKGYRAFVELRGAGRAFPWSPITRGAYFMSPLMPTEAAAREWFPPMDPITCCGWPGVPISSV